MSTAVLTRLGIAMLALALIVPASALHWIKTRVFEPVDLAISLDAPQVDTEPFAINLSEDYLVDVGVDWSREDRQPGGCSSDRLYRANWTVYRLVGPGHKIEQLWASSDAGSYYGFHAPRGIYRLRWDVPSGAKCLNGRHPRLRVLTDDANYRSLYEGLLLACIFVGGTGVMLILKALADSVSHTRSASRQRAFRLLPEIQMRSVLGVSRNRRPPLIHGFPNFGIAWFCILAVLLLIHASYDHPTLWGLSVPLKDLDVLALQSSPWPSATSLYIDNRGRFLVNGRYTERGNVSDALQRDLGKQAVWIVYVEADPASNFGDTVYSIDTIYGLGAKPVWVTPKMRAEFESRSINRSGPTPAASAPQLSRAAPTRLSPR